MYGSQIDWSDHDSSPILIDVPYFMNSFLEDSMLSEHSIIFPFPQFLQEVVVWILFIHSYFPVQSMRTEACQIFLISLFWLVDVSMSNWNLKLCCQILYCSVCLSDTPNDPSDFFPLSVHYQERLSAAGRTRYRNLRLVLASLSFSTLSFCILCNLILYFNCSSGGFFKREGKAKDHEVYHKNL